jgi:GT2 family glycosyltransferase
VLNYRTADDTLLAVRSLLASRSSIEDVVVVDNDPSGTCDAVLADVRDQIVYLPLGRNLGFSGGVNTGIAAARSRGATEILLVNSDVIVPPDCLAELRHALASAPAAGIAAPVVMRRSEPDRVASLGMSYRAATGRMRHAGVGHRLPDQVLPVAEIVDGASGCVMLVKTEVFDAVGMFDEEYFFGFEDLDLCLRAARAGHTTVLAGRAVVYHEGGRSIGARSAERLYFAARNHLRLARRARPDAGRLETVGRGVAIVGLNLVHAMRSPGRPLPIRVAAVFRGTADYLRGRFGSGRTDGRSR